MALICGPSKHRHHAFRNALNPSGDCRFPDNRFNPWSKGGFHVSAPSTIYAPQAPRVHLLMLPDPSSYVCLATQTVLSLDFHILARICIVDYCGTILFDSLVRPTEEVTNWLPERTGFDPSYFTSDGPMGVIDFEIARQEAVRHVNGKTIVGYKLWQSLDVLQLSHPADLTRDVATYFAFQTAFRSQSDDDGLQKLLREFMHRTIQHGYENAVEDACATIDLFRSAQDDWESLIADSVWPCLIPPPEFKHCYT